MTLFRYRAKDKDDNTYDRTVDAKSRSALYTLIREEGGNVVSVKEVKRFQANLSLGSVFGGVKTNDKIILAKNLSSMIKAGLSVTRSMSVMEKQAKNKTLKKLLADLSLDVSKGETLSDALAKRPKIFSPLFVSMVKAGEESGNVSGALAIVGNQMEKSNQLVKKVKGALIYPAVILSLMVVIGILMLIYMVPTLTATFEGMGVQLPLSTRIIIASSGFMINHTLLVISMILGLIVLFASLYKSSFGKRFLDVVTIHIPVIGPLVREVDSARTARTLSSLLTSGVDIVVALDVTIDVMQNHLYKDALTVARAAIQKGEAMSAVFVEYDNLFPLFVGEMIAVGEETGKISEMLLGVADYYENEVDQKTKDLSTIIEPILMIIIGAGVGVFAISMLLPTYSLVNVI